MNDRTPRSLAIAAGAVVLLGGYYLAQNREHDRNLERAIVTRLLEAKKTSKETSFDLQPLTSRQIERVCTQYPYQSERDFETKAGSPVAHFKNLSDNAIRWWFFGHEEGPRWIEIEFAVMAEVNKVSLPDSVPQGPCARGSVSVNILQVAARPAGSATARYFLKGE